MNITIKWDEEANVWIAINDEIGLALESGSYDALIEKVRYAVPELLELNHMADNHMINFHTANRQMAYA